MNQLSLNTMCWKVWGLKSTDRCDMVHQTISVTTCHIVCFEKTKLSNIDAPLAAYLVAFRLTSYAFKLATGMRGTRGGILILWNLNYMGIIDI